LRLLSAAYGTGARLRRDWYRRHPHRVRSLDRPVISVGNLTVGGSGKTPIVAAVCAMLRDAGERPVILSRGYGRRDRRERIVIVSDETRVLEPAESSGDEPQMLARDLAGVPVVVGADRFEAGQVAQSRFDCTVFVLDDGFQHVQLARDVDLLVVSARDLAEELLPSGRLREPLHAAVAADAVLVDGDTDEAERVAAALQVPAAFTVARRYEVPRAVVPFGGIVEPRGRRVVAIAGIARPERFFAALRAHGWDVARELRFRDHHWFSATDMARIVAAARESHADLVMTTEKDAVRLQQVPADAPPVAFLPMRVSVEPRTRFLQWLLSRLRQWGRESFSEDTVTNK
jgi:tetraacyldisaccharide 4'-kinase